MGPDVFRRSGEQGAVGEQFALIQPSSPGVDVVLTGTLRQDARAPGGYELDVLRLAVIVRWRTVSHSAQRTRYRILWNIAISGCVPVASMPSCAFRHEIIRACRNLVR